MNNFTLISSVKELENIVTEDLIPEIKNVDLKINYDPFQVHILFELKGVVYGIRMVPILRQTGGDFSTFFPLIMKRVGELSK